MDKTTLRLVLVTLFDLGAATRPATVDRISIRAGLDAAVVRCALGELGRVGLVDPVRVRLTLAGLGVAAAVVEVREGQREGSLAA